MGGSGAPGGTPDERAPFPLLQREEARKSAAQALLGEVAAGNAELAERKRQQRAAEAAEDLQIADYIRQRDIREQVGWTGGLGWAAAAPAWLAGAGWQGVLVPAGG